MKTKKYIYLNIITLLVSIAVFLIFSEFFLRVVPIAGIDRQCARKFDNDINVYRHTPNTRIASWNRNELIERKVNSEGYLDSEHTKENLNKTFRIGFFGDSYVEATQVSLENTFFKIIENNLKNYNVETLAFGTSGHGIIHSYLKSKKYAPYFSLDMVVYVFCENDLGDQIEEIKQADFLPYVKMVDDQLVIDQESLSKSKDKYDWGKLKRFFYNNSILFQNILKRLSLLKEYGIKLTANKQEMNMATKSEGRNIPDQNDLPSSWPESYRIQAVKLGEKVIDIWSQEIKKQHRKFAIFYIPRATEWRKDINNQDSWKSWLKNYCQKSEIDFIDPTASFIIMSGKGKEIYDGHFSAYGHQAFADAFVDWFVTNKIKPN